MELPRREPGDVFVAAGAYGRLVEELRAAPSTSSWSPVIASAFDHRTRVMPFRWIDTRVVPCGARSVAGSLLGCGFDRTRVVLGQWNPRFSPTATVAAGHPIDILLISSMGLHAADAYRMIRDAHQLGEDRPLILVGGPKAIYEPEDCFGLPPEVIGDGADVAVTGEVFVLLELLRVLADEAAAGEHPLSVFRQDLDQLPMPLTGYSRIEPPGRRRRTLRPRPWPMEKVRRKAFLATLEITHGCRFNCDFCPIPAYQQRTWRHKSPERIADEMKQLGEEMHYRNFFGTDDNFFNDRDSAEAILEAMAASNVDGRPFSEMVHFTTEATEFDVFKNRDLLPLAREAGMRTIFFGIEDLSAKLINKGQTLDKTRFLFAEMRKHAVAPYAMMIHHDDQPLWSRDPERLGALNQARRLFELGAVGYHTTYITPSMGARNVETMFGSGNVFASVGGVNVPEAFFDGNHIIATRHRRPWVRQVQLWLCYLSFYNPLNLARTMLKDLRQKYFRRRFKWQLIGGSMIPAHILKTLPWAVKLAFGKVTKHPTTPKRCLPMVDVSTREGVLWGVDAEVPYEVGATANPAAEPSRPVSLPIIESGELPVASAGS